MNPNVTVPRKNSKFLRFKRDADLHEILFDKIYGREMTHRHKRDTLEHVESVMETVKDKLSGLQVSINEKFSVKTGYGPIRAFSGSKLFFPQSQTV